MKELLDRVDIGRAWQAFIDRRAFSEAIPSVIVQSWQRSRDAGVDPRVPRFRAVDEEELQARLARNAPLVAAADRHLPWVADVLGHLSHVVYVTDVDGIVLRAAGTDPGLMQECGLVPGMDWSERRMGTNGAGTAVASGGPVMVYGCEHYCQAWHEAACMGAPIVDASGRVIGAIDLTTSLADADPALLVLMANLARTMGAEIAGVERSASRDEARGPVQIENRVLRAVAHDLQNPLTAIRLSGRQLVDAMPTLELRRVESAARRILRAVDRMDRLIRDLLDVGAVQSGKLRLRAAPKDGRSLLLEAREAVSGEAEVRGVRVIVDDDGCPETVRCDEGRITQVLVNLLTNAIKFSPAGGEVLLRAHVVDAGCRFEVSDEGDGVDADLRARLFEPFARGGGKRSGTGLGLAIARGLVEAHGGGIGLEPREPRGTTFWFTLPKEDPHAPAGRRRRSSRRRGSGRGDPQ